MLKNTWFRRLAGGSAALLVLMLAAWAGMPSLIKSQLEARGRAALGRAVTVGAVDFKPWTLELSLADLKVASADGQSTQLALARVYVDAEIQSLLRLAPVVDALRIEQPQVFLTHLGDGHYDVDDVLQRLQSAPDAPPTDPLRFALYNLVLTEGALDFSDLAAGGKRLHTLRKLDIALPFLSNFDSQRDVSVQPHLAFELNGSRFDTAAQGTPFATDRKGEATLQISQLDMAPYLPYLPASLPVRLKSAVLDSSLKLSFAQTPSTQVVLSGDIKVSGIRLQDPSGAELLTLGSVHTVLQEVRPLEHSIALQRVDIDSPNLLLSRNRAGGWNLPGASAPSKTAAKAAPQAPAKPADPLRKVADAAPAPAAAGAPNPWKLSLAQLQIRDGQVRLRDDSVAPAAQLSLADTQIAVTGLQWPFAAPAHLEATAQLQHAASAKPARLQLSGDGSITGGKASASWSDLALSLAAPYLGSYLLPPAHGRLEGELDASWKGSDVQLLFKRLALHDFALLPPAGKTEISAKELPSFKLLELSKLAVDPQKHSATLDKLALQGAQLRLLRNEDGQWMYTRWLPPSPATAASDAAAPAPAAAAPTRSAPWSLSVAELGLDGANLVLLDRLPAKPVFLEFGKLQTRIKNLTLDGKKPAALTLSTQVRSARTDPGTLRFDGTLMWDPLLAQGTLDMVQFPAQALGPYGLNAWRLDLLRADTSFKGQLRYASRPNGPEVQLRGDASVAEMQLHSALKTASGQAASEELLNWKALSVPGIDFSLAPGAPMRLAVREVSLSDFFARLIISAEGRLVLQDILNPEEAAAPDAGTAATVATSATPPATSASAPGAAMVSTAATLPAPAPAPAGTPSPLDPVIDIGPIRLVNGRVAFSDRFIKPNYSANLTELSGSLSRFQSQNPQGGVQMADLELRGRAEGTASLEVTGKLNPLAKPLALDITGKVRDLELSPLSSYAIKYAGYGIERGKLSVDVKYTIAPDGQLQAANNIVLNQLVFGDAVQGAKTLPVKLAVALLADRNGVIDLNLPVSGSLNDPQFRIWPIVWKIVGNLIAKALTSPFTLLASLVGGGDAPDTLSSVAFEPGTSLLNPAGRQGLDTVAKALLDRNSLRLTVVGTASLEREDPAIRRERLNAQVLAEKRRQAASAGQDVTAVAPPSAEEYPALLKEVYRRSGVKKPRNLIGLSKDLPTAEMEQLLLAAMVVSEDHVRELAMNRSVAVREYLTARQLPSERLFLGAAQTQPAQADWQPRAELSIESN